MSGATPTPAVRDRSIWWRVGTDFVQSRVALGGLVVLALVAIAALCAPWITPQNPYDLMQLDVMDARLPPGSTSAEGGYRYVLGTDGQGRDLYSAIIYGLRISLLVGLSVVDQPDGSRSVSLKSGVPLVAGGVAGRMALVNQLDGSQAIEVAFAKESFKVRTEGLAGQLGGLYGTTRCHVQAM